ALLLILLFSSIILAQGLEENLIKDLRWRNIGPANMGGRISDIEALDNDFTHLLVASASGGVWKSVNGGNSFEPIFDNYSAASIGDIALFQPDPDIIWVGTGEECGRNSAAWGNGVFKSTDGGQTFESVGLEDTYSIGTVLTHPTNPDIAYVAALGCIWSYDVGSRGFFKTTNGGKTWTKLAGGLPDDGRTGAVEAIMHPEDPNTIYVAFWERLRTPYRLDSGGPGEGLGNGGIYKTTDGGRTFTELTNGFPEGQSGKIGLAISKSNPKVMMAYYEHSFQPPQSITDSQGNRQPNPDYADLSKPGSGIYRSEDGGDSWKLVNRYQNRPFYYSHVWINPHDDKLIYFLTGGFSYSDDGGYTTKRFQGRGIHSDYHALWLDPTKKDRFYVGNDGGIYLTNDQGNNFFMFDNFVVSQFYMIGVDMRDPYYVYGGLQDNGTWGGPSATRDRAIYTDLWYTISGGDGYHVQIDPTDWRIAYSEPHPGNTGGRIQRTNIETREVAGIRPQKGENIVNYDDYITQEIEDLQLEKGWGESPGNGMGAFRWNWSSPIIMSPHNPNTVFFGANHVLKTVDQGETWYIISPDLTKNDYEMTIKESGGLTFDHNPGGGAEFHGTIITISESSAKAGVIWAGTDDGNVQVTTNGGISWTNVRGNIKGVPNLTRKFDKAPWGGVSDKKTVTEDLWVSRVEASHFDAGTCYVTFDGHRSGIFDPFVYKTTDFGKTWTNISSNLPKDGPVYVIEQDFKNPDLLFTGTEFGVFYTVNGGRTWTSIGNNMPTVAYHDLVVHPRDFDLVAGTHGRGLWVMDDITPLQQATPEVLTSRAHLFENRTATKWLSVRTGGQGGAMWFGGENPERGAAVNYYIGENGSGTIDFEIRDVTGENMRTYEVEAEPGINRLMWDMRFNPPEGARQQQNQYGGRGSSRGPEAPAGDYLVTMRFGGRTFNSTITLRDDPLKK
ncbi:hypothetical protein ACFL67_03945, partial [candidate division KSB1 bacterium]